MDIYNIFLNNEILMKTWGFYKDYLIEKGARMKSGEVEQTELEKLFSLSEQSPERAVRLLDMVMVGGYTSI